MKKSVLSLLVLFFASAAFGGGLPPESGGAKVVGVEWQWQRSQYNNDTETVPSAPENYTLTLEEDGTLQVQADCNAGGGGYTLNGQQLTVNVTHTTMAMCPPDSHDTVYLKDLAAVQSWMLRDGDLVLLLKFDTGSMRFISTLREQK